MRIQKLEVKGFKSFGDKTRIRFGDGITGIVGPNGCGKSNVVDAVRWCMGEMSAKHLRGKAMQDIIFAGSDNRGPLGMAEVNLTFENDGSFPPHYADYSELTVTRRLHRDGTSEYLINKVAVRLKDITELFLGTGVGTHAYSIIEQGRVGFIINSKPEERRALIEELAGISKFKLRKRTAQRRLDATRQNLSRINDIIAELERQLGTLRRQAKKAERYGRVKTELRDLDLHASTIDYLRLEAAEKLQSQEKGVLHEKLEDAQRDLGTREAGLEAERLRLVDEEQRLQGEQQSCAKIDMQLAQLEKDLEHWRNQLQEAEERITSTEANVGDARNRMQQGVSERSELDEESLALQAQLEEDKVDIENANLVLAANQNSLLEVDQALEKARNESVEHMHTTVQVRTRLSSLANQEEDIADRRSQLEQQKNELERRLEKSLEEQSAHHGRRSELSTKSEDVRRGLQELQQRALELHAEYKQSSAELEEFSEKLNKQESKLSSLQEIAQHYEGYDEGVKAILGRQDGEQAGDFSLGLSGLVSEIVEVDSEYELALEGVLGEKLQYIICDDDMAAYEAIEFLKSNKAGRSGFIPANLRVSGNVDDLSSYPGVIAAAEKLVRVEPTYAELIAHLLRGVWLVENIEAGRALLGRNLNFHRLVTRDGDVLDPNGLLFGGRLDSAGLLERQRQMRDLAQDVEKLSANYTILKSGNDELRQLISEVEGQVSESKRQQHHLELEMIACEKDCEASKTQILHLRERQELFAEELLRLNEELALLSQDQEKYKESLLNSENIQARLNSHLQSLQEQRLDQMRKVDEQAESVTKLRVRLSTLEAKLMSTQNSIERIFKEEQELSKRIDRDIEALKQNDSFIVEMQVRLEKGKELAVETAAQANEKRVLLAEHRRSYELDRENISSHEGELKKTRQEVGALNDALTETKMELHRFSMEREQLFERVLDRHDISLHLAIGDYHHKALPGEEAEHRRGQLERSLKAMGSVNLSAIEECESVEERFLFLQKQRDDLVAATESLERAILRMNRVSRKRFREAFEAVNTMFQEVFPKLFKGGEARLELTEAADVLEAGVDIIAQPPGKKLQNVGLLSGGEKALTATALIFAMFLIKPTPFCILDEVDAPLDDANVGRFNNILREIAKHSQFIVITHNKATMAQVDRIYGITMEEPGLSKVVSVDFDEDEAVAA
ncbi:MAG: chromosome segregation protein SMC [Myxococcales bacterium]|nr:chromosome segregation protein SMC [Myxococcales bacterium]